MTTNIKAQQLRELLIKKSVIKLIGAHNPLGAKIGEQVGFDAIWASGFELSASRTIPDANLLTMTETLEAAKNIAHSVNIPVIADCDSGYGDVNNVIYMIKTFEAAGIAGVCIEDKIFPKLNSFADGPQELVPVELFCEKLIAAKDTKKSSDFLVIARIESFIAGYNLTYALARAYAYEEAGADALLIHSKKKNSDQVVQFARAYAGKLPIVIVPTTYPAITDEEIIKSKIKMVIYANQGIRASVLAMHEVFSSILKNGTSSGIEDKLASIETIFALQDMPLFNRNFHIYKQKAEKLFQTNYGDLEHENRNTFTSSFSERL